jgi:hypothetical protein
MIGESPSKTCMSTRFGSEAPLHRVGVHVFSKSTRFGEQANTIRFEWRLP